MTHNFYRNMPVHDTLLVRMPGVYGPDSPELYPRAVNVAFDTREATLPEATVRDWLSGLDVVYTAETPYDWRMPQWCKDAGVKLVVHGMPEFYVHENPMAGKLDHPDQWWWPTSWRTDVLPKGRVMPVPHNVRERRRSDDPRLHILHVIGHRAIFDRNGTDLVVQALRSIQVPVKVTIHAFEGGIPHIGRNPNVEVDLHLEPTDDRWAMFDDQDVLLMPRRYGGLCLPALEAASCGLIVAMPDCSPNEELAAVRFPCVSRRRLNLPGGSIPAFDADARQIAASIKWLARQLQHDHLAPQREEQKALLPTWDVWRDRYLQAFSEL
jgi:hypothetical protein